MGKYMKKSKIRGDMAVMEVSQQTALGVRTRAKTLALQSALPPSSACNGGDASCYLELRSRRLEKPAPASLKSQQQQGKVRGRESSGGRKKNLESRSCEEREGYFGNLGEVEGSCGDNFDSRERSTRESTPCSLIRDSDNIGTPGSTTRQTSTSAINRSVRNDRQSIPTTNEMEEFFANAEQQQHHRFREKYNFDFVSGVPLPGRYEWVQVTP